MTPEAYKALADRQLTYWWHRSRRSMAASLLRRHGLRDGCHWLDVGCGPGGNLHMLDLFRPVEIVGVDLSPEALSVAAQIAPTAKLIRTDINDRLPFESARFDVVTIFNVLYHQWVQDDSAVLSEIARVLKPTGLLLITEPAFESLRRHFDETVMTRRRFSLRQFAPLVERAGFRVLCGNYFTSFGAALLALAGLFPRADHPPELSRLPRLLNEGFRLAAELEARLVVLGIPIPFGTTLVMVAQRREPTVGKPQWT